MTAANGNKVTRAGTLTLIQILKTDLMTARRYLLGSKEKKAVIEKITGQIAALEKKLEE